MVLVVSVEPGRNRTGGYHRPFPFGNKFTLLALARLIDGEPTSEKEASSISRPDSVKRTSTSNQRRVATTMSPDPRKKPRFHFIDGYRYSLGFAADIVRSAKAYKPRPDDVFIVTYPKCGTTWMQQIVYLIFHKGEPPMDSMEYFRSNPFMEMMGAIAAEELVRPGALKYHTPFSETPYSPEAKYIYVARNPKDCCVSFYHHVVMFPEYDFEDGSFDVFFDLFLKGEVEFGDYFDHLLSWYEHRNDPNVFFTTYEEMKSDTRGVVLRVARFLGSQYAEMLEKDETTMQKILRCSSFDFMKENVNQMWKDLLCTPEKLVEKPNCPQSLKALAEDPQANVSFKPPKEVTFVRKGITGNWRKHFTPEQNQRMDEWIRKRAQGTDVMDLWKDYDCL